MPFTHFAIFVESPFSSVPGAYCIYYEAPGQANSPRGGAGQKRDYSGTTGKKSATNYKMIQNREINILWLNVKK